MNYIVLHFFPGFAFPATVLLLKRLGVLKQKGKGSTLAGLVEQELAKAMVFVLSFTLYLLILGNTEKSIWKKR